VDPTVCGMLGVLPAAGHLSSGRSGARGVTMSLPIYGHAAMLWSVLSAGGQAWLHKHFQRRFKNELEYMLWLGETASLRGTECIQANCVAALALAEF